MPDTRAIVALSLQPIATTIAEIAFEVTTLWRHRNVCIVVIIITIIIVWQMHCIFITCNERWPWLHSL